MNVIFSRKGFDSKYGGGCSPVMPDGKLLSIPIPAINVENGIPYSRIKTSYGELKKLMNDLHIKLPDGELCHLDPDIVRSIYKRKIGWRGIFGQAGAASAHLQKLKVGEGDIFLFFGSFRNTIINAGQITFDKSAPKHIIFGYLVIA